MCAARPERTLFMKTNQIPGVQPNRFRGLIAAPFTPFHADGSLNLDVIPDYASLLRRRGVQSVFVCGTTGEGASLTTEERELVAEAWMRSAEPGLSVIVHVGGCALGEARRLAGHAARIGAAAFAALAPYFFKPASAAMLGEWCAGVASAAASLPFYFYHIPSMTGVSLSMREFLAAAEGIPNLAGIKYTHEDLADYAGSLHYRAGRYDLLFGRDELLYEGWMNGARGAVGSTYNYASPLYLQLIASLEEGDLERARMLQDKSIEMIAICNSAGVSHLAASKALMSWLGVDCGPVRLPLAPIDAQQLQALEGRLEAAGYFEPSFGIDPLFQPAGGYAFRCGA